MIQQLRQKGGLVGDKAREVAKHWERCLRSLVQEGIRSDSESPPAGVRTPQGPTADTAPGLGPPLRLDRGREGLDSGLGLHGDTKLPKKQKKHSVGLVIGKRHTTKAERRVQPKPDIVKVKKIEAALEKLGDPFDDVNFVTKKKFALNYYLKHLQVKSYLYA